MNWMRPQSRAKMASSLSHLLPVRRVALDADTAPAAQEIANLRKEAQAFKSVRAALRSKDASSSAAKMVFQKVWCSLTRYG